MTLTMSKSLRRRQGQRCCGCLQSYQRRWGFRAPEQLPPRLPLPHVQLPARKLAAKHEAARCICVHFRGSRTDNGSSVVRPAPHSPDVARVETRAHFNPIPTPAAPGLSKIHAALGKCEFEPSSNPLTSGVRFLRGGNGAQRWRSVPH